MNNDLVSEIDTNSIYIIGTGGTIAGNAATKTSLSYESGKLNTFQLTQEIPDIKKFGTIKTIDLFHIDSSDITIENWLLLAKTINELLQQSHIKSIVVTHGTDTLEETAYFLNLVIKSHKPVVLVGSMRPASSISPDGPINLYNALAVAASPESLGKGVLVTMNDQIFNARDVTKTHTTNVDTFKSLNTAPLGHVNFGEVNYQKTSIRKNTLDTPFDVSQLTDLPRVEIIYEYAGTNGCLLEYAIKTRVDGIIIAGSGNGNMAESERNLLKKAREQGINIVRSSRTGSGNVTYNAVQQLDSEFGLIPADNLNPQKARILLMLALTLTSESEQIYRYFQNF